MGGSGAMGAHGEKGREGEEAVDCALREPVERPVDRR